MAGLKIATKMPEASPPAFRRPTPDNVYKTADLLKVFMLTSPLLSKRPFTLLWSLDHCDQRVSQIREFA